MDKEDQVTRWVENKIGKVLDEDLKIKIVEENSSFDVNSYVNYLLDKYFNENEIENFKKNISDLTYNDLYYFESENSSEEQNSIQISLGFETNEYQTFPVDKIIKNLENDSEEVKIKFLRVLELSVEDLITPSFLDKTVEILQKNLITTENKEVIGLVLKIFQKLLKCPKNSPDICKRFTSIAEVLANQIEEFNFKVYNEFEKEHNAGEEKWVCEKKSSSLERVKLKDSNSSCLVNPEILIKMMKLLLDCQQQILTEGVRYNDTKYREIIFTFIHLLNSTMTTSEITKLSGLELVSVLDPQASWCKCWCHTAVGRALLCSALRKYKNFFIHIIEIMLRHIKSRNPNRLPPVVKKNAHSNENFQKFGHFTEPEKSFKKTLNTSDPVWKEKSVSKIEFRYIKDNNNPSFSELKKNNLKINEGLKKTKKEDLEWIIKDIPRKVISEAVFFHSLSVVNCLTQFRSGRSLFPVQTTTKKRLLNVQDLSFSIIEYLENSNCSACNDSKLIFTAFYQAKVSEILEDLKKLKTHINSSRVNLERQLSNL